MQTVEQLKSLFAFNDWANRRVLVAVRDSGSAKALRVLAHIVTTEIEYFERLYGKDSKGFDFWPSLSAAECGDLARDAAAKYERLLRKFDEEGLDLVARYRTSEGVWCENTFRELLMHVILHSATHRGNLLTILRDEGHEPPVIDHITYLRETKYF